MESQSEIVLQPKFFCQVCSFGIHSVCFVFFFTRVCRRYVCWNIRLEANGSLVLENVFLVTDLVTCLLIDGRTFMYSLTSSFFTSNMAGEIHNYAIRKEERMEGSEEGKWEGEVKTGGWRKEEGGKDCKDGKEGRKESNRKQERKKEGKRKKRERKRVNTTVLATNEKGIRVQRENREIWGSHVPPSKIGILWRLSYSTNHRSEIATDGRSLVSLKAMVGATESTLSVLCTNVYCVREGCRGAVHCRKL